MSNSKKEIEQMFSGIDIRSRIVDEAERRGRVEELKYLVSLVHSDCTDCLATKKFLEERIKVLGGKQNG